MRLLIFIYSLLLLDAELIGQSLNENLSGKVSFISSQNVYVKFNSTNGISSGDTLFILSDGKFTPVLIVKNLSSVSCVCTSISSKNLSLSQNIIAKKKVKVIIPDGKVPEKKINEIQVQEVSVDTTKRKFYKSELRQKINGSISAYSYSDFSNTAAKNSTQLRYTYRLDMRNIGDSRFSLENYISFRHKLGDWSVVKNNIFDALKIYTFAVRFDPDKTTRIILGRTINNKISSIGAMDGLQAEKTFNKISLGAVVGYRPDFSDYGFDNKLLQYGAYLSFDTKSGQSFSESSLAFMQQMNNMKTDRRFLYFQHSNALVKNVYFFSTFEVDLFKVKNDLPQNTFDLTSMYLSLRFRITDKLNVTGSYDQRKNIIFYETYKTLIDSVLENENRQSFRLRANYRITNNLTFGIESGYRFLNSDTHPSKNIYGYITYYQVPGLNISITLNGTYLESAFMNGKVFGADISKDLFHGLFQSTLGYRYIDYSLPESLMSIRQNIGQAGLYWQFTRKMSFSANYEGTFEKHDRYNRFYFQLRKRF